MAGLSVGDSLIPVHIIHLGHRKDREASILAELEKQKITDYEFVPAIHGETLDLAALLADGTLSFERRPTWARGQIGCYFSHLNILKSILDRPEEMHLILEDDVCFVVNFKNRLNRLLLKIKDVEWDIFYIGINCTDNECREGEFVGPKKDGIYYPKNHIWGTHAYIIKKSAVAKIIDMSLPVVHPWDVFLMSLDIKKLTLIRQLALTRYDDSDTFGIV